MTRQRRGHRGLPFLGPIVAALVGVALIAGGCGGDDEPEQTARGDSAAPRVSESAGFPKPSSRSLRTLLTGIPRGPELAASVGLLEPGENRFGFALFDRGNRQIGELKVALYVARGLDETARGPFPAWYVPIDVKSPFRSRQTVEDADSARSVYVSKLRFPSGGGYAVAAVAELGRRLVATPPAQVMVRRDSDVPAVGERAIRVHTPTEASVGGDLKSIETRIPPDGMHEVDLADALDRGRPVLLLFSTPALCQSRVCGPVTDIAEQVKADYDDRADFIHMEIYRDNEFDKGPRPQVEAWHLPGEPFAFAIDSDGIVVDRLEGAFGADELRAAVRAALR